MTKTLKIQKNVNKQKTKFMKITTLFCFVFCLLTSHIKSQEKPNIILVLADDLGYGDLSCYGSQRIETPALDKMAKEGLKFNQFYAASAVCTPTRVSILTGQYPLRFSVSEHFNDQQMFLNNTMLTIPKALKKQGYVSKHIGKWHLGGLNKAHILQRSKSMPGPLQHGFDSFLTMIEDPLYRGVLMKEKRLYKDAGKHLVCDDEILPPNSMHWTSLKFLEAREFISKSVKKKQPFFLNLWLDAPHAPYETSTNDLLEKYKERTTGIDLLYRGMVSQLDEGVGTLLVQLNNLGIAENTLVIFTSDNGPAYLGSPAHLKGRKTDFYEGGIRVPMIAWWPGTIKANRSTNVLSNTVDLLPTFVSLSSGKISAENPIDGLDLSPVLLQNESIKNRKTMFWEISSRYKRSSNYKKVTDIRRTPVVNQIARNGKWKLLALEGNALELYNIDEDPYERWNLIKQYPIVANGLYEELLSWLMEPREKKPY